MVSFFNLRRGRDSNPRNPLGVHTLSKRTSSATRAPLRLQCKVNKKFLFSDNLFEG